LCPEKTTLAGMGPHQNKLFAGDRAPGARGSPAATALGGIAWNRNIPTYDFMVTEMEPPRKKNSAGGGSWPPHQSGLGKVIVPNRPAGRYGRLPACGQAAGRAGNWAVGVKKTAANPRDVLSGRRGGPAGTGRLLRLFSLGSRPMGCLFPRVAGLGKRPLAGRRGALPISDGHAGRGKKKTPAAVAGAPFPGA